MLRKLFISGQVEHYKLLVEEFLLSSYSLNFNMLYLNVSVFIVSRANLLPLIVWRVQQIIGI